MSLRAQAAHGLKWQAIEIAGRQLLSLAVFTTLARLLDPEAFGLVGMVGVYLAFVGMFVDQGIGTALVQRKELEPDHLNSAFLFSVACGVALCGMTIALAGPIARAFDEPQLVPLLRWSSFGLVLGSLSGVQNAIFIRELDFRRPAIRTITANFAGGIFGMAMAIKGFGVWALIGQQLCGALASALFIWIASTWRPRLRFSWRHLRDLLTMSLSVLCVSFLWFFSSRLDQAVIGRYLGVVPLGNYVVAGKLVELMRTAVGQPIAAVSVPALSRLQEDYAKLRGAVYQGMDVLSLIAIPSFVGLAAITPTAVTLFFGTKWDAAIVPMQLLSLYALANILQTFFHPTLLATGGPGTYVVLNVFHAVGTAIACVVGAKYGIEILILGLIINTCTVAVFAFMYMQRRVGFDAIAYWTPCAVPVIASIAMGITVISIPSISHQWMSLIAQVTTGILVYIVFVLLLAPKRISGLVNMVAEHFRLPFGTTTTNAKVIK